MAGAPSDDEEVAGAPGTDFALVSGDPLNRAQRAIGLIPARGFGTGRRVLLAVLLTWLPLALWAAWNHRLLAGDINEPLARHFGIHARFLIALPLFLISEGLVQQALRRVLPQFVASGLVDAPLLPAFRQILHEAARLRDSRVALAAIFSLVLVSAFAGWQGRDTDHELVWTAPVVGHEFIAAWFHLISRPIFQLVLFTWIWRLVVVARLFQRIAGLDLKLAPTHPDRAGGLAFVEKLPPAFAPFFFGVAVAVTSRWGHEAMYHGVPVSEFHLPSIMLVVAAVLIGTIPLTMFAGRLAAFKRKSRAAVGALLAEYGRLFDRRWLRGQPVEDGGLLSAPEIGPVADTVALFDAVSNMRIVPVSRTTLLPIALAASLPMVPVLATQIPLKDALLRVIKPLIGL